MSTQEQNTPTPCEKCGGSGHYYYSHTGTYHPISKTTIVGWGFTWGICDKCWGTGDENNPGESLLISESKHP